MDMLLVKAAAGIKLPMQGDPRKHITEALAQEVPDTAYYRKALLDGDLVVEAAPATTAAISSAVSSKQKKD